MRGDLARGIGTALVVALLTAASCEGGALPAQLGLGVTPSELELERGAARTVEVRVARAEAPGPVQVEPVTQPAGLRFDPVVIAVGESATSAVIEVAADAPLGAVGLVLEASAGGARATATVQVRVVAPLPSVATVTLLGGDATRSVRQGAGSVTLRLEGSNLEQVDAASVLGAPAAVGVAGDGRLDVAWSVPHGAPLGPAELRLLAIDGRETVVADALTVTPITAGPLGDDDTGRGTPAAPVRSMTRALSLAGAGDEVLLLEGSYSAAEGEVWPSYTGDAEPELLTGPNIPVGVTVRGVGRDAVTLLGPGNDGVAANSVALAPAAGADLRDLTVSGFAIGVVALEGSVTIADARVSDVSGSGVAAGDRADVTLEGVMIGPGGSFGLFSYGGARITLVDSTVANVTYGATATQSAALNVVRSSVGGLVGIMVLEDASLVLEDAVVEGVSLMAIAARDRTTVELRGGTVRTAQIGVDFGGRVLRVRDSAIVDHREIGLLISGDPAVVDLGTGADPGGNVLQGSSAYQLHDARDPERTVVITLSATVFGDEVPAPRLANGPVDEAPLLLIEGAGNKVAFD
ncbi:MAG: DUF1565 domain-containing protein [Trueperaceae bacterium]|nr:MAG: DUF1565 domain-containing protein [Trueperaceae bacterium]